MKKCLKIFFIIIAIFVVIFLIIANVFLDYALKRTNTYDERNVGLEIEEISPELKQIVEENKKRQEEKNEKFLSENEAEIVEIKSFDNLNLKGYFYENKGSDNYVILIHGYKAEHKYVVKYASNYFEGGYNVLAIDLRACGQSEGQYITMGWLERLDVLRWIDFIINKNKNAKIIIHGESMGAATTMMLAGEKLPDNVKVLIEDSGYTSIFDIFKSELKVRFNLPSFPILDLTSLMSKIRLGFSFKEASSLKQVEKSEKPILFIHGTGDDYVPFYMLDILYNAKKGDKEKIVAVGGEHVESIYVLGDEYFERVFEFINKYNN